MAGHAVMKCRKCGRPAVLNMRHHKLALCEVCYPDWLVARVEETIRRFAMFARGDKILVAVSGGKDSLALWDILHRLGYSTEGVYIGLGISEGGYSELSGQKAEHFAAERGLICHVVDVARTYGLSVPALARARRRKDRICSLCGLVKRHIMNRMAYEGEFAVIVTGHNLDDEVATLLGNTLHWQTGYLSRQAPVLPSSHPRLARKAKPLCLCYEREVAAYAVIRGIQYIYDECPYSVGAKSLFYKELLNQLESRSPGAKLQFYLSFLRARQAGEISFRWCDEEEMNECLQCGQPTSAAALCAFCRSWERISLVADDVESGNRA